MKPTLFFILKLICVPLLVISDVMLLLTAFILWDEKYIPIDDVSEKLFKKKRPN